MANGVFWQRRSKLSKPREVTVCRRETRRTPLTSVAAFDVIQDSNRPLMAWDTMAVLMAGYESNDKDGATDRTTRALSLPQVESRTSVIPTVSGGAILSGGDFSRIALVSVSSQLLMSATNGVYYVNLSQ